MKEKVLAWRDNKGQLGVLGGSTSHPHYKIGDVIVYRNKYMNNQLTKAIICSDKSGNDYPMGLAGTSIIKLLNDTDVIKVIGYEYLSNEFIEVVHPDIVIVEKEVIELRQDEIEKRLGYRIKIVKL